MRRFSRLELPPRPAQSLVLAVRSLAPFGFRSACAWCRASALTPASASLAALGLELAARRCLRRVWRLPHPSACSRRARLLRPPSACFLRASCRRPSLRSACSRRPLGCAVPRQLRALRRRPAASALLADPCCSGFGAAAGAATALSATAARRCGAAATAAGWRWALTAELARARPVRAATSVRPPHGAPPDSPLRPALGERRRRQRHASASVRQRRHERAPAIVGSVGVTPARIVRQNLRRDHHDQLGLILLRRLALEQVAEDRDVADAGNLLTSSTCTWLFIRPAMANVWPFCSSSSVSVRRVDSAGMRKPLSDDRVGEVERADLGPHLQVDAVAADGRREVQADAELLELDR